MAKKYIIFVFLFLLSACASTSPGFGGSGSGKKVMFVSFPPGADIEISEEIYVGKAPVVYRFSKNNFNSNFGRDRVLVIAYPNQDGYCQHEAILEWGNLPEIVHFDMSACPLE